MSHAKNIVVSITYNTYVFVYVLGIHVCYSAAMTDYIRSPVFQIKCAQLVSSLFYFSVPGVPEVSTHFFPLAFKGFEICVKTQ